MRLHHSLGGIAVNTPIQPRRNIYTLETSYRFNLRLKGWNVELPPRQESLSWRGNLFNAGDLFKYPHLKLGPTTWFCIWVKTPQGPSRWSSCSQSFSIHLNMQLLTLLVASAAVVQAHYNFNALISGGTPQATWQHGTYFTSSPSTLLTKSSPKAIRLGQPWTCNGCIITGSPLWKGCNHQLRTSYLDSRRGIKRKLCCRSNRSTSRSRYGLLG